MSYLMTLLSALQKKRYDTLYPGTALHSLFPLGLNTRVGIYICPCQTASPARPRSPRGVPKGHFYEEECFIFIGQNFKIYYPDNITLLINI